MSTSEATATWGVWRPLRWFIISFDALLSLSLSSGLLLLFLELAEDILLNRSVAVWICFQYLIWFNVADTGRTLCAVGDAKYACIIAAVSPLAPLRPSEVPCCSGIYMSD